MEFAARAERFARECAPLVCACIPFAPDSNLVRLALNPRGNTSVEAMSRFIRELHDEMRIAAAQPVSSSGDASLHGTAWPLEIWRTQQTARRLIHVKADL